MPRKRKRGKKRRKRGKKRGRRKRGKKRRKGQDEEEEEGGTNVEVGETKGEAWGHERIPKASNECLKAAIMRT